MSDKIIRSLNGLDFIRSGDKVFIMNIPDLCSMENSMKCMEYLMERSALACKDYHCPFSILTQFDQWFTWWKRVTGGESTGRVTTSMVYDLEEIKKHQLPDPPISLGQWNSMMNMVPKLYEPRYMVHGVS